MELPSFVCFVLHIYIDAGPSAPVAKTELTAIQGRWLPAAATSAGCGFEEENSANKKPPAPAQPDGRITFFVKEQEQDQLRGR